MIFSKLSLKYRIALVIFILEAIMLSVVLSVTFTQSQQTARKQHAATTGVVMSMLSELSSTALLTEEYADIQSYFSQTQKDPTVIRALLADISNNVVAATNINEIGQPLPNLNDQADSFWLRKIIEYPAGKLGTLAIEFSTIPLKQSYNRTRNEAVSIAIIGMGTILVVGILVGFALTRRLEALTLAARNFAEGDTEAHCHIKGNDEIGRLGKAFDHMIDEVGKNHRHITQQNERIRLLMDSTAEGIFGLDGEGNCSFINKTAVKMLGYESPEELTGKFMHGLIRHHHADGTPYPIEECYILRHISKGQPAYSEDEVFWRHDGTYIPVEYWAHPMYEDGNMIGVVVAFIEISRRKAAQAEMKRLNSELKKLLDERTSKLQKQATILDQIHDSVVITDMSGNITSWNKGAERLLGYTSEEAIGRYISFVYPEDQHIFLRENIIKPLQEKGEHELEVVVRHKEGKRMDVHLSLSILRDEHGTPVNMVGYSLDITDRKRAEREQAEAMRRAEEASRTKSEFLSRMSHELRTPMNAILGFAQLLEKDPQQPLADGQRENVEEILHAGNHLLELINEVLDLSRIEANKLNVISEATSLYPLLQECSTMIKPMAEQFDIQLHSIGEACNGHVLADRTRLKQVLINLLNNAVKYNHQQGSVRVSCTEIDDNIQINITDTGPGLTSEQVEKLFTPFERLDADDKAIEGTGIGLALSKRLIQAMQGDIGVQSVPGTGSTFWIRLPKTSAVESDVFTQGELLDNTEAPADSKNHKVLCVEDNPANMRLIEAILNTRKHIDVLIASTPGRGLELARNQEPALILLDINLPDMDGYAVMQQLQENETTRNIPVVAISANAMPKDLEKSKAAGFYDYLTKPLDLNHTLAVVDEILSAKDRG